MYGVAVNGQALRRLRGQHRGPVFFFPGRMLSLTAFDRYLAASEREQLIRHWKAKWPDLTPV